MNLTTVAPQDGVNNSSNFQETIVIIHQLYDNAVTVTTLHFGQKIHITVQVCETGCSREARQLAGIGFGHIFGPMTTRNK